VGPAVVGHGEEVSAGPAGPHLVRVPRRAFAPSRSYVDPLHHRPASAAIDPQDLAGHVPAAGETANRTNAGHVPRGCSPPEREGGVEGPQCRRCERRLGQAAAHVGLHQPGRHDVHGGIPWRRSSLASVAARISTPLWPWRRGRRWVGRPGDDARDHHDVAPGRARMEGSTARQAAWAPMAWVRISRSTSSPRCRRPAGRGLATRRC